MNDDLAEQVANLPDNKKIEFLLNFAGNVEAERDQLRAVVSELLGPIHPPLDGSPFSEECHCWACLVFLDDNNLHDLGWHETWCPYRTAHELLAAGIVPRPPVHEDEEGPT